VNPLSIKSYPAIALLSPGSGDGISLTKSQPAILLPQNKFVANSNMSENLNAIGYVKK
jgi:hypothetical protein